jgi:hypothetical protein
MRVLRQCKVLRAELRPCKGPSSILTVTLYLSLFYLGTRTHLPLAHLLAYRYPFPIRQPVPLDSYIASYLFALGSLIALMMEASRTSETSVDIDLTTRQYIPEDSELHGSNVCYYTKRKSSPLKDRNEQGCYNAYN